MTLPALRTIRRTSQIFFFLLFLFLLFQTEFRGSFEETTADIRLPYPVSFFLEADPLVGTTNALATRSLYRGLLWGLIILVPTFYLGRFFCGWICPFGSLNHYFSSVRSERKRGARLIESNRYQKWQALKYYVLAAVLVAALFGSLAGGLLDPISFLVRSLSLSVLPAIGYAVDASIEAVHATGVPPLQTIADGVRAALRNTLLSFRQPYFRQGFLIGLLLVGIVVLNLRYTRFWCRALCPLGALLGIASRWSILGLEKQAAGCDDCKRCLLHCQGGDDPIPGAKWRKAECHLCFNCASDCASGKLRFRFFPDTATTLEAPQLQRRKLVAGLAVGVAILPLLRTTSGLRVEAHERLIRPPGSLDEDDFLARCIRCGACMKVCPNNALHPTLTEAGIEGLWTPVVVPRIGYCEPSCVLCGEVCPTGAIWAISQSEKLGSSNGQDQQNPRPPLKIGTAFYDHGRCLPYAMATECIVCEEWCPTSPKAIYLRPVEVFDSSGRVVHVRQPHLDVARCTGCGACEHACPVSDRPAVYVTSIGESRSKTNQILLERMKA
jgi:polyferredoxin